MNYTQEDIKKLHKDFEKTFDMAYIGIPSGFSNLKKRFIGTISEFKKLHPNLEASSKIPMVLYMHGSGDFVNGDIYRNWIVNDLGFAFIAPKSYAIKNRPTYISPSTRNIYNKIHALRQCEIINALKNLQDFYWIDKSNMFLMGNSEGGLATAIYKGDEFKARIILAWGCEDSYFSINAKIGSKINSPILSIIGSEDEYFGKNSKLLKDYKNKGNCIDALSEFSKSKVVVLPKTKHDLTKNPYTKYEIINFLKFWRVNIM